MKEIKTFRYNNTTNSRKDCLFTIKINNLCFYGISRCNLKVGDKFEKELAKTIAVGRCIEAKRLFEEDTIITFDSGDPKADRMGVIATEYIPALLEWFDSLVC